MRLVRFPRCPAKLLFVINLWVLCVGSVCAAPADMRVITDEISEAGTGGIEFQTNIAQPVPSVGQGQASIFQGIIEPTYGIAESWEASLQLPVEQINGNWYGAGFNTELQYVTPHDKNQGAYWGWRAEVNLVRVVGSQMSWQSEFRAVFGCRIDRWHLVLNPSITVPYTGLDRRITFEPSAKAVRQISQQTGLGLEYFVEAGPVSGVLPSQQRYSVPMLVVDTMVGGSDFNLGVGKGVNNASDRWVMKAILSVPVGL